MLRLFSTTLLVCLLLAGRMFAQTPEIEAKKQELENVRQQMGSAGSTEEYDALLDQYNSLGREIQSMIRDFQASNNEAAACAAGINNANDALRAKDYAAAKSAAEGAIEACADASNPKPFYCLGLAEKGLGNARSAVTALQSAIAADSSYTKAWLVLAKLQASDLQQVGAGLATMDLLLAREPNNAEAWCLRGRIESDRKSFANAINNLERGLGLDADQDNSWILLVTSYVESGKAQEAISAAARAIKAVPESRDLAQIYFQQAHAYNMAGEFTKAVSAADNALANVGKLKSKKSFIQGGAQYERGMALEQLENIQQALASLGEAASTREWKQQANYEIERIKRERGL